MTGPRHTPWRFCAALFSALLAGALAFTFIGDTPEAPDSPQANPAGGIPVAANAHQVPPAPAPAVADAVPGAWTLAYDWGCDGSYISTSFTAASDGTWTSGGGYTGLWVTVAGMLTFTFDGSETTYSGVLAAKSVTGIQSTFTGTSGCFYLLQSGAPTGAAAVADSAGDRIDESGRPLGRS
jgi:hypothetical protein